MQYNREMGETMEPFNLKEERGQGYFDESAGFVWRSKKDDKVLDPWLAHVDADNIVSYAAAAAKRAAAEEGAPFVPPPKRDLFATVLSHLKAGETVPTALRRLKGGGTGAGAAPTGWRAKLAATKAGKAAGGETFASPEDKAAFEALTESADMLMGQGATYVFQERKEQLANRLTALSR